MMQFRGVLWSRVCLIVLLGLCWSSTVSRISGFIHLSSSQPMSFISSLPQEAEYRTSVLSYSPFDNHEFSISDLSSARLCCSTCTPQWRSEGPSGCYWSPRWRTPPLQEHSQTCAVAYWCSSPSLVGPAATMEATGSLLAVNLELPSTSRVCSFAIFITVCDRTCGANHVLESNSRGLPLFGRRR